MRGAPKLIVFPDLKISTKRQHTTVENLLIGTRLQGNKALTSVLEFFREARSPAAARRRLGIVQGDLDVLCREYVLIPEEELELLRPGLCSPVPASIGKSCRLGELSDQKKGSYVVVGAPVDMATVGDGGARHGPSDVRSRFPLNLLPTAGQKPGSRLNPTPIIDVEMRRKYAAMRRTVLDLGNVVFRPGENNSVFGARLERIIEHILACDGVPATIGGDHSITWFILNVLLRKIPALGVIHFDAHHDLYPDARPILNHGNPFVFALKKNSLKHLRQLGLRRLERPISGASQAHDARLSYFSARELQRLTPEDAFAGLPTSIPYYLSFDVDCIDPSLASSTGTPEVGGLSYYQALELLDYAYRRFTFVGADFVEVAGSASRHNKAASVVAQFMARFFLARESFSPLESCLFEVRQPT